MNVQNASKSTQNEFDKVHINESIKKHMLLSIEGGNISFGKGDLALCIKIKNLLTF